MSDAELTITLDGDKILSIYLKNMLFSVNRTLVLLENSNISWIDFWKTICSGGIIALEYFSVSRDKAQSF